MNSATPPEQTQEAEKTEQSDQTAPSGQTTPLEEDEMADTETTNQTTPPDSRTKKPLKERVVDALWNAMELRVVSVVSPISIQHFDERYKQLKVQLSPASEGSQKALFTSINLVTGDIRSAVSPEYEAGGDTGMPAFHARQVELARETVANNLQVLCELSEKFATLFDRSPD